MIHLAYLHDAIANVLELNPTALDRVAPDAEMPIGYDNDPDQVLCVQPYKIGVLAPSNGTRLSRLRSRPWMRMNPRSEVGARALHREQRPGEPLWVPGHVPAVDRTARRDVEGRGQQRFAVDHAPGD